MRCGKMHARGVVHAASQAQSEPASVPFRSVPVSLPKARLLQKFAERNVCLCVKMEGRAHLELKKRLGHLIIWPCP